MSEPIRWRASTAAPRCCAGSARPSRQSPRSSRAPTRRGRAACSTIWRRWPEAARIAAPASCASCCATSGRSGPRASSSAASRSATAGATRPCTTDDATDRAGAAAQAFAMAGLLADRAAAGGGHRGDRHRRPHRPCRIPQRRALRRHGRAGLARSCARPSASTRSARPWSSSGARSPSRCSTGWRTSCASGCSKDAESLPLASVLQGGTWAAGRQIARERRADGAPPIKVISDGTVF